ncbi:hypothetical protein EPN44_07780 [bacterium]|nr:MAG: hypothetical protein EPN44_07780 [bacterium]
MYRRVIAVIALIALGVTPVFAKSHKTVASPAPGATSESSNPTMPRCASGDPVVWVNTGDSVYHLQGDKYYGRTKHGKYECQSAAKAEGDKLAGSRSMKSASAPRPSAASADSTGKRKHRRTRATPGPSATP